MSKLNFYALSMIIICLLSFNIYLNVTEKHSVKINFTPTIKYKMSDFEFYSVLLDKFADNFDYNYSEGRTCIYASQKVREIVNELGGPEVYYVSGCDENPYYNSTCHKWLAFSVEPQIGSEQVNYQNIYTRNINNYNDRDSIIK